MYPALAVLQTMQINGQITSSQVLWVGSQGGMEAGLIRRAGIPYQEIPAAGVHGVGWRALPGNILQLAKGYFKSLRIIKDFKPDVLFFTGGYIAVPMALAGRQIASLLFIPDIQPGLALQRLTRLASKIAVSVEESRNYVEGNTNIVNTGYPTRPELIAWSTTSQAVARQSLGLNENLPVLLIFGGSKGSRSINRALLAALPELLQEYQVVHISGELDWPEVEAERIKIPTSLANRYHLFPYLHDEMGAALRSADLAITRAGASTLGELPLFQLPAILVPYPYAWQYQKINAQFLAERGAALLINDTELATQLIPTVQRLMKDALQRNAMQHALKSLAQPEAASTIANTLLELAQRTKTSNAAESPTVAERF